MIAGLTVTAEGIPLGLTGTSLNPRWFASCTRVSNLTYLAQLVIALLVESRLHGFPIV